MGWLRSCYQRPMRLTPGGPLVPVRWYFTRKDAAVFPFPHRFGPATWDSIHKQPSDLGDQADLPMRWSNGANINGTDGRRFAGPVRAFRFGALPFDPAIPRGAGGVPVACLPGIPGIAKGGSSTVRKGHAGLAGLLKGGLSNASGVLLGSVLGGYKAGFGHVSTPSSPPGPPCAFCTEGTITPQATVTLGGFAFPNAVFNGTHVLHTHPIFTCTVWIDLGAGFNIILTKFGPNNWRLQCNGIGFAQYDKFPVADCHTGQTMTLSASTIGGNPTCVFTVP